MQVIHIHISTTGATGKNGVDIHIQSIYPSVEQGWTGDPGRKEDLIQNVVKLPGGWLNNLKEEVLEGWKTGPGETIAKEVSRGKNDGCLRLIDVADG